MPPTSATQIGWYEKSKCRFFTLTSMGQAQMLAFTFDPQIQVRSAIFHTFTLGVIAIFVVLING